MASMDPIETAIVTGERAVKLDRAGDFEEVSSILVARGARPRGYERRRPSCGTNARPHEHGSAPPLACIDHPMLVR